MLVLTVHCYGELVIGDGIRVKILDISPGSNKVRIGVEAPKEIPVFRSELLGREEKKGGERAPR